MLSNGVTIIIVYVRACACFVDACVGRHLRGCVRLAGAVLPRSVSGAGTCQCAGFEVRAAAGPGPRLPAACDHPCPAGRDDQPQPTVGQRRRDGAAFRPDSVRRRRRVGVSQPGRRPARHFTLTVRPIPPLRAGGPEGRRGARQGSWPGRQSGRGGGPPGR